MTARNLATEPRDIILAGAPCNSPVTLAHDRSIERSNFPLLANQTTRRVPLDKREGVVKQHFSVALLETAEGEKSSQRRTPIAV
jgi:hypothetical protein